MGSKLPGAHPVEKPVEEFTVPIGLPCREASQNTPTTDAPLSRARLAGTAGIAPEANPITNNRPFQASERASTSNWSPPTGSNITSNPSGPISRSWARRSPSSTTTSSAPSPAASDRFSSLLTMATTRAPSSRPTWMAAIPTPPGGAGHQQRLSVLEGRSVYQCMDRGSEDEGEGGDLDICELLRCPKGRRRRCHHLRCPSAVTHHGHHPITCRKPACVVRGLAHSPGDLEPGRKGELRAELIPAVGHEEVGEVDAGMAYLDTYGARGAFRHGEGLLEHEVVRSGELMADERPHRGDATRGPASALT